MVDLSREIEDWEDRWEDSDSELPFHQYLGISLEELNIYKYLAQGRREIQKYKNKISDLVYKLSKDDGYMNPITYSTDDLCDDINEMLDETFDIGVDSGRKLYEECIIIEKPSEVWVKLIDEIPTVEENGEKVLLYRILNESQESMSITIHNTSMVKHCDPNETWWTNLPKPPINVQGESK